MNYGGHLDNALLLTLVSEARMRFFQSLGYTELNVEGVGFHGEVMQVSVGAADLMPKGFDLVWCINEKASGREVARGKTGIVCFDYTLRKVAALPQAFRTRLLAFTEPAAAPTPQ